MSNAASWKNLLLLRELPDPEGFLHFHDSSFTQFPKFPAELRRLIWEAAIKSVPPQVVDLEQLDYCDASPKCQPSLIWNLLHVNQESRKVIRKNYIFIPPGALRNNAFNGRRVYLNKSRDILRIDEEESFRPRFDTFDFGQSDSIEIWPHPVESKDDLFNRLHRMERIEIRNMIMHKASKIRKLLCLIKGGRTEFPAYLKKFHRLKEVTVVPSPFVQFGEDVIDMDDVMKGLTRFFENLHSKDRMYKVPKITLRQGSWTEKLRETVEAAW